MSDRLRVFERAMYARLGVRRVEIESHPASAPASVLFLDLNIDNTSDIIEALRQVRRLAPVGLGHVRTVVVRSPSTERQNGTFEKALNYLESLFDRMQVRASVGFAYGQPGVNHTIEWGSQRDDDLSDQELLVRCREVEIAALLHSGRALWKPDQYHYRLPSGRHSGTFVRLADAVRSVRDAEVLAWWLLEHAQDNLGIVIDSSTILPIVLALQRQMLEGGHELGRVQVLGSYPSTISEFTRSIREVSTSNAAVLALLSVSSSGSIRDKLVIALNHMVKDRWVLHTLVDKAERDAHQSDDAVGDLYSPTFVWVCLNEGLDEDIEGAADTCRLCRSTERSRVVQIDPKSFDGLVLPDPKLVTPHIQFAESSRNLWRFCDEVDAIDLDAEPHPHSSGFRPHRFTMGIRLDFDPLIEEALKRRRGNRAGKKQSLVESIVERVRGLPDHRSSSLDGVDLVVGLANEFARANGRGRTFVRRIVNEIMSGAPIIAIKIGAAEQSNTVKTKISQASKVCIVTLGVVTGASLHRTLAQIQAIRRDRNMKAVDVVVLAIHLRPATRRDGETIMNPFGKENFLAVYESLLPYEASPLRHELEYLINVSGEQGIEDTGFYPRRLAYLQSGPSSSDPLMDIFWGLGTGSHAVLRPGSWYGELLSAKMALVAVGSAVQRQRDVHSGLGSVPEWKQFEIPAIMRSYFDPLIVCSVLRWLQPEECWWGREIGSSAQVVDELVESYSDLDERRVILAELLLASAMGKVPTPAISRVMEHASAFIQTRSLDPQVEALECGLEIVKYELMRGAG